MPQKDVYWQRHKFPLASYQKPGRNSCHGLLDWAKA